MEQRYFENPYLDYNPSVPFEINKNKILKLIQQYVTTILENTNPKTDKSMSNRRGDLYVGDAGIAFMFLKLNLFPEMRELFNHTVMEHATNYIVSAKNYMSGKAEKCCAFLCGDAGIYAVSTAINHTQGNVSDKEKDLKNFLNGFEYYKMQHKDDNDEFLVGKAGYLAGMYFLNSWINPMLVNSEDILTISNIILNSGRKYAEKCGYTKISSKSNTPRIPMMFQYHGKEYLGAAHGISGIMYSILESPLFEQPENTRGVYETIEKILTLQQTDGNFSTKFKEHTKLLVHWCHGCPGCIYLFAKAYLVYKEDKFLAGCIKCADIIWKQGLLYKGPGLCHGIAGNAYAFLLMYRLTKEQKYLYRAHKFMEFLTDDQFVKNARIPDRPYSLFEGLAGTVCFLVDLLEPDQAHFPFMDIFAKKY